jgi:hypothetical protein
MRAQIQDPVLEAIDLSAQESVRRVQAMAREGGLSRRPSGQPPITFTTPGEDEDGNIYTIPVALTELDSTETTGIMTWPGDI